MSVIARHRSEKPRHCELLHFRGCRKAKRSHAKVWQSTAYPKRGIAPNRLVVRAVKRFGNSLIIGRSPRISILADTASKRPKMKILAMTKCISTISGKARYCRNFLLSPPNFTVYKNKSACPGFREPDRPTSFLLRSGYCPPNSIR